MKRVLSLYLSATLTFLPAVGYAQTATIPLPYDTIADAIEAGKLAGRRAEIGDGMAALGLVGGLIFPAAFMGGKIVGGGALLSGVVLTGASEMPPETAAQLTGHSDEYQRAFRDAWNRTTKRRKRAKYLVGLRFGAAVLCAVACGGFKGGFGLGFNGSGDN